MVEPAGAMAMFVLRLAGILSLENAHQDQRANVEASTYNLTTLGVEHTTMPFNFSWSEKNEVYSSTTSTATSTTTPATTKESVYTSNSGVTDHTTPSLLFSAPSTMTLSPTVTSTAEESKNTASSSRKSRIRDHITHVSSAEVDSNKNITKFNRRRTSYLNSKRRKFSRGQLPSISTTIDTQVNSSRNSGTEEIPERTESYEQTPIPRLSGIGTTTQQQEYASENVVTMSTFQRLIQEEKNAQESTSLTTTPIAQQSDVYDSGPDTSSKPQQESLPSDIAMETSVTTALPKPEVLAGYNETTDRLGDHMKLKSLEAPPEDFIASDFDYYDFGDQHPDFLGIEAPTLSSLNLVSAVPSGRFSSGPILSETVHRDYTEETRKSSHSQPRKLPPARPIPPAYPRAERRNNPYPYGPKLLPGPYAPLTPNLPSTNEEETREIHHVTQEYSYEDFDYYYESHESEDSRYEVQTKEPPILFVFDKPGYSPEAPTTLPAPTRSPTPSDPWDCAPRCPRYTLLDWNTDYDVRQYPETSWVSTVIISDNRVLAELEGYMRVQDYFYGLNDQGLVLNLTIPFVTQIKFGKHPGVLHETNDYTISLYVQPNYYLAAELPTPISNEVLVDVLEPKTVFVHSFEANVWDVTEKFLEEKVEILMNQLRHNGEAFLDRYYYLASYSRPELYQPVYYEIWVYATNFRDPQTSAAPSGMRRIPQTNKITQKTLSKLCRGVECPSFEVLRTYKYGIQKRRYFNALFASTSPRECQFTTMSVWKGFMPLHLYKHGINSHMEVIEATRPIALVNIRDSSDPNTECPQNMTMSLYLPQRLHSNPPVTGYAAPEVQITAMNDVIVYAYTVGGYLLDPRRVRKELADMKYRLSEFGACYKDDEYYVVIYDFIVRYHGRQNEIWIVAENCKATHNG